MALLLHVCCAPCLLVPSRFFYQNQFDFTCYFFNPNIHPFREFKKRLDAVTNLCSERDYPLIVDRDYGLKSFLRSIVFREDSRCRYCYDIRLKKTAQQAAITGFDSFSSTLLYSIHQNHVLIKSQAQRIAEHHQIQFIYQDFRGAWNSGVDEASNLSIYRQKYCGCIFSEQERYDNRFKKRLRKKRNSNV